MEAGIEWRNKFGRLLSCMDNTFSRCRANALTWDVDAALSSPSWAEWDVRGGWYKAHHHGILLRDSEQMRRLSDP